MNSRFTPFARDDLAARQQQVFDDIASGPRGTVPWIFHLYLNSPELASRVQELGAFCRYGTSLPPRLSELAILIVAHHWKADYEWAIHAGEARKAGLSDDLIAAIEAGRRPVFDDPDAELLYDFATQFFRLNDVPDALFASRRRALRPRDDGRARRHPGLLFDARDRHPHLQASARNRVGWQMRVSAGPTRRAAPRIVGTLRFAHPTLPYRRRGPPP